MKFGGTVRVETLQYSTKTTAQKRPIEAFATITIYSWWHPTELNVYRICSPPKGGKAGRANGCIGDIRVESLAAVLRRY